MKGLLKKTIFISLILLGPVLVSPVVYSASKGNITSKPKQGENPKEMIEAITKRTRDITEREENIRLQEDNLKNISAQVDRKIKELNKAVSALETVLSALNKIDKTRLEKLAKVYENMPPEEAASRLEEIDPTFAIRLVRAIKGRKAGKIMGFIEPKTAARLSEGYAKTLIPKKNL